jgi:hypothetical protein
MELAIIRCVNSKHKIHHPINKMNPIHAMQGCLDFQVNELQGCLEWIEKNSHYTIVYGCVEGCCLLSYFKKELQY